MKRLVLALVLATALVAGCTGGDADPDEGDVTVAPGGGSAAQEITVVDDGKAPPPAGSGG